MYHACYIHLVYTGYLPKEQHYSILMDHTHVCFYFKMLLY